MPAEPPSRVAIDHDDYHARHVGRTADGRQFFLTTPFQPSVAEFVALYLFDAEGSLLEARIDALGPRHALDEATARRAYERRLAELGAVTFQRIIVEPFSLERFGTTFGLVPCEPEGEDDDWVVEMQPGNYMAFYQPWDSGVYDT